MSIKLMVDVWASDLDKNKKAILVKYADFANDDGSGIFPSVGRVAWETGYSERSIQRITKLLVNDGILVSVGINPLYKTNEYVLIASELPERMTWKEFLQSKMGGDILTGGGDNDDKSHRVTTTTEGGDTVTPYPLVNPFLNHHCIMSVYYFRFCELWEELFPEKPKPRKSNKTLQKKMTTRLNNDHFVENWDSALRIAAQSVTLQSESWFNPAFFLKNDDNYVKCLDRWMSWKDDKQKSKTAVRRYPKAKQLGKGERIGGGM